MTGDSYQQQLAALHDAIEGDEPFKVKQLSQSGVDVNDTFDANINPSHAGITPLALACALNLVDVVGSLIEGGADVNKPFATLNTTALMTSSYHGHVDVVKCLLENGADSGAIDLQQSTALGYAFGGTRNMDVIQMLLDAHIDVNRKNMLGMNALLLVAGYGNEDLVQLVLEFGADSNTTNDFGHSALHLAVVGKRDTLKKMRQLGSSEAAAADRSLNRRNLDLAMQEWARIHREEIGGSQESQDTLAKTGRFMMSLGHQLQDDSHDDEDDREALRKRVAAVAMHRQKKIDAAKDGKKSGIWNLLSCGGGKAAKAQANQDDKPAPSGAKPYSSPSRSPSQPLDTGIEPGSEVEQVTESFVRILRILINAGCEIDKTEKTFGMTALDLAILNGDVESAAVLISNGGNPDHFPQMLSLKEMYKAVIDKNRKDVKMLLQCDEDLDLNQPLSRFTVEEREEDEGMTLLAVAVRENDLETSRAFIKQGADINLPGTAGRPPVSEAANYGLRKQCEMLLSHHVDIEQTALAYKSATPLTIAVIGQRDDIVALLIKRGAKVDKRMIDNRDALMMALRRNDTEMTETLLQADLNQNFHKPDDYMYKLAKEYQGKMRDTPQILEQVADMVKQLEDQERVEAEREAAEQAAPAHHHQEQPPPVARKHQEEPPKQPSRRAPAVPVRSQPPQSDTADGEWEEDHRGEGPVQAAVHEEVRERLEDQLEQVPQEQYQPQPDERYHEDIERQEAPSEHQEPQETSIDDHSHEHQESEQHRESYEEYEDEPHREQHHQEPQRETYHQEPIETAVDDYSDDERPPPVPSVHTLPPESDSSSVSSEFEEPPSIHPRRMVTSSPREQAMNELNDEMNRVVITRTQRTVTTTNEDDVPMQYHDTSNTSSEATQQYHDTIDNEASTDVVHQEVRVVRHTVVKKTTTSTVSGSDGQEVTHVQRTVTVDDDTEQEVPQQMRRSSYLAEEEDLDDLDGSITSSDSSEYSEHDDSFHRPQTRITPGVIQIQRGSHNTTGSVETEI